MEIDTNSDINIPHRILTKTYGYHLEEQEVRDCDLRSQNILLGDRMMAKATDFGLAKLMDMCGDQRYVLGLLAGSRST